LDGDLDTYKTNLEVQFGEHKFTESILVAYTAPRIFEDSEGIVGLSFLNLAQSNSSFLQTLIDNNIIQEYSFGVNLNFQQHGRSVISFGAPNPTFFSGSLKQYPIRKGFYEVTEAGFSLGNGHPTPVPTAIFDTGNTCISIPN
jgi:hypothetical protein